MIPNSKSSPFISQGQLSYSFFLLVGFVLPEAVLFSF
jgi:hypothetical protein